MQESIPRAPQRILLVRLSHLGDVVHALPVFRALRQGYPGARIGWVVQTEFAELLQGLPGLDEVLTLERRRGIGAWVRLHGALARFGADWTIDAQGNLKSALATLSSGAARRTGLARQDWREPLGAGVLTDRAPAVATVIPHALDRMHNLARHVSPGVDTSELGMDPGLCHSEREAGRATLNRLAPGSPPPIVLHLSQEAVAKGWPTTHAADLARLLAASGLSVVVVSGPGETTEGRAVEGATAGIPGIRHWIGQRGLRALIAVFAAAAERGGRFVGVDSGPLHLAVAAGLATVVLEGPEDHRRTGPWPLATAPGGPGPHTVLRSPRDLDCAPCRSRRCRHLEGPICMSSLSPEQVARVLSGALGEI